jgi:hypothetical protein
MRTILIAQPDITFAEQLAATVRSAGDRVITCPGPLPPAERCIRCDKGYCPLTEGADLMIYDPHLTVSGADGKLHNLALESAVAHPDVPMLLAWSSATVPDLGTLRAIRTAVPRVRVAKADPAAFLRQVHDLLETQRTESVR